MARIPGQRPVPPESVTALGPAGAAAAAGTWARLQGELPAPVVLERAIAAYVATEHLLPAREVETAWEAAERAYQRSDEHLELLLDLERRYEALARLKEPLHRRIVRWWRP